jgi:RNA polymerase sigma factor (sigma-70 family)
VEAGALTRRPPIRLLRSKRLLALAGDERLVEQIRRGNELAFEVAFERHGAGILAFCRHMLRSREEAEDVVQHTFAAAFRDFQREDERRIALKAWLYTIARNRCVSVLRARREHPAELEEVPTDGLSEQVERRAELRELLADVGELPEDQRAALLLAEAAGLSHSEVAAVLGCEVAGVKGLVFRARSGLIERRMARDTSCAEIREQLATLRGGALRRNELRFHLRRCPGCSAYRDELRRQRQMLAVALPVAPTLGLKGSVLSAAGIGGGAVGGASAGAGAFALGSATVAKVAMVGVLAGGSVVAGEVVVDRAADSPPAQVAPAPGSGSGPAADRDSAATETGGARGERISAERSHGLRGAERRAARSRGNGKGASRSAAAREKSSGGRRLGQGKRAERGAGTPRGDGGRGALPKERPQATAPRKPATEPRQPPPNAAPKADTAPKAKAPAPATEPVAPVVVPEAAPAPAPGASAPGRLKQSK